MKKRYFLLLILSCLIIFGCKKNTKLEPKTEEIIKICDMAVLECYYHTTAEIVKGKKEKKQWIDFDSTIKIGIDASKIKMTIDKTNINIKLPKAKLLGEPDIMNDTMKFLTDQTGVIKTKFTNDERSEALAKASEKVIEETQNNSQLMNNAETRAKKIIDNYIVQIGELTGVTYTINWEMLEES